MKATQPLTYKAWLSELSTCVLFPRMRIQDKNRADPKSSAVLLRFSHRVYMRAWQGREFQRIFPRVIYPSFFIYLSLFLSVTFSMFLSVTPQNSVVKMAETLGDLWEKTSGSSNDTPHFACALNGKAVISAVLWFPATFGHPDIRIPGHQSGCSATVAASQSQNANRMPRLQDKSHWTVIRSDWQRQCRITTWVDITVPGLGIRSGVTNPEPVYPRAIVHSLSIENNLPRKLGHKRALQSLFHFWDFFIPEK